MSDQDELREETTDMNTITVWPVWRQASILEASTDRGAFSMAKDNLH